MLPRDSGSLQAALAFRLAFLFSGCLDRSGRLGSGIIDRF
jgi:hypothetical protein